MFDRVRAKAVTKQINRRNLYHDRIAAARGAGDSKGQLSHAVDYIKAVARDLPPEDVADVARQLYEYAAKADGVDPDRSTRR